MSQHLVTTRCIQSCSGESRLLTWGGGGGLPAWNSRGSLAALGTRDWARSGGLAGVRMPSGFSTPCRNSNTRCLRLIFNLQSKTNLH